MRVNLDSYHEIKLVFPYLKVIRCGVDNWLNLVIGAGFRNNDGKRALFYIQLFRVGRAF